VQAKSGTFKKNIGVADPSSVVDPAFQVNPDTDPDQKLKKKNTAEIFFYIFFCSKIAIYLSLGLFKGRPSYRRSLQPSKENIQHF
jgi:hypothetical protein